MTDPIASKHALIPPPCIPVLHRTPSAAAPPPPPPPVPVPKPSAATLRDPDSTIHLIGMVLRRLGPSVMASLPRMAVTLTGIFALNLVLMTARTERLPGPVAAIVSLLIFVTGAYTSVIPKTFFWVLVLTFGRSMLNRVRTDGFDSVRHELTALRPTLSAAWARLETHAMRVAMMGAGVGLILSNFLSRNNRVDKFAPAIALAAAIINGLGTGTSSTVFMFARTVSKDIWRMLRKPNPVTNDHVYVFMAALAAGLLVNGLLGLTKSDYIGYITGVAALVCSSAIGITGKRGQAKAR